MYNTDHFSIDPIYSLTNPGDWAVSMALIDDSWAFVFSGTWDDCHRFINSL